MQVHASGSYHPPAKPARLRYPHILLHQDSWDNFGYTSTFGARLVLTPDKTVDLGGVKIARDTKGLRVNDLPTVLDGLEAGVASLGQSIAYYRKLGRMVPEAVRRDRVHRGGFAAARGRARDAPAPRPADEHIGGLR